MQCVKQKIPAPICGQDRITQYRPFEKCALLLKLSFIAQLTLSIGSNETYEILSTSVRSSVSSSQKTAQLGHYPNGPTLNVECCEFLADEIQILVLWKNRSGCHWMPTTPYCLTNPEIDISSYIQECVGFAIDEECRDQQRPVSFFF